MKLLKIIAAASLAVTATVATAAPAEAQRYRGDRYETQYRGWNNGNHRGWDNGRHRGWDNRRAHYRGYRGYNRTVCWREWRWGDRVTVCRRR